ncbi:MAG: hypothetical protein ACIAQF_09560 [Phycisphaerales bacterium JB065]
MTSTPRPAFIATVLLALSPGALGQNAQPIDPGYADVGPLQISLRALPEVMRHDTAFEHVYQSPADPNQRYRVAGGVYAVFNNSDYVATRNGSVAVYPADVRFYIGPPPGFDGSPVDPATAALLRYNDPRALQGTDLRAMDREPKAERQPVNRVRFVAPLATDPTISNEQVRQRRLREITARALREANPGG